MLFNGVHWSPLETGLITERIYLILESIKLHRMCSKALMDKLLARSLDSPQIHSSTMDPVDSEGRYF